MAINFDSGNMIIFWYPQYSGGKFIMNCLSLSKHAIVLDKEATKYLVTNPADYDYRMSCIMKTLPPPDKMSSWLEYEFPLGKFYGVSSVVDVGAEIGVFENLRNGQHIDSDINDRLSAITDSGMSFYSETRGSSYIVKKALDVWPNAKIVMLTNIEKFWHIAAKLKNVNYNDRQLQLATGNEGRTRYEMIKGNDWPDWHIFEKYQYNVDKVAQHAIITKNVQDEIKQYYQWHSITAPIFSIDVDNTYFDKEKFLSQMQQLYRWLGYTDFNEHLISKYYTRYIELHK